MKDSRYAADITDELLDILYKKHQDYGPLNIAHAPGGALNGLRVRMHDKLARLNHLVDNGDTPNYETIEDTEGLADELNEASDEKLLSALDDFVQNNPRAEKVIEQYNAKMKEKLAAQQLDEVEPPVMQVRGKDQDFKDLDVKDIKANIKKIEADIKKLKGKTDLTDQERENLAILEFNLALANKYLNYKLNFKESPKRSKVIKEVSKVIDQQGDITFDETTNQYTVNGNKLEKVNKEIERVISEKYQEKQRDQIAQIYNNTLAKNNSVDEFITELKAANLPGFTEDTYNELSEKLKALTGETAQSSLEPTTTTVDKKADIETYFSENTRSTKDSKYNPDLSGEGSMALMEQENELLELGADKIQAHGMAKGSIGEQFNDLLNILTNGLDAKRGGGMLYTAPLVISKELISAGAALGTSGGTAYKDGAFIILAKKGVNTIRNIDDIGGVLINQAVADTLPELISKLKELFPNLSINSYSNSPTVISEINAKYDSAQSSLEPTTIPVSDKKADIEQQKQKELENNVKELEEQRKALRSEDGSIPADKMSEFKRLGEEINKAKAAAGRGNSVNSMLIKRFPEGADTSVTDPEALNAEDKKEAADIIEQVIQNSKTAEEALKKIQRLGYVFDIAVTQNLRSYLEDRFNTNAPRIGNNKDSFQAWIYGKTDAELDALEGKPTTAPTVKPEDLKINVTATTKKGGMELAEEQDSTIASSVSWVK